MRTNASIAELERALAIVNKRYKGNVSFNEIAPKGRQTRFTLRVVDSHGPGHRTSTSIIRKDGKHKVLASACWHVHGHFFEALLKVKKDAWVQAGDKRITAKGGNWQNWNIGSMMNPMQFSEACDCHG